MTPSGSRTTGGHLLARECVARPATVGIGRVSLVRENEAGGSWGQEIHILHVNV